MDLSISFPLSLILCPSFLSNPSEWSWVLLIPNITFCFRSSPSLNMFFCLHGPWFYCSSMILHHLNLIPIYAMDVIGMCVCVSIFVWTKCVSVCDWVNFIPHPLLAFPLSVKERMRLEREEATRLLEEETEVRPYALPVLTARIRAPGAKHRTCCHLEHEQMSHTRTSEL